MKAQWNEGLFAVVVAQGPNIFQLFEIATLFLV
jgi:hypothetical protein